MDHCLDAGKYHELINLRNVVAHRGTPPPQHFLNTSGSDTPSSIPSPTTLVDLASRWHYEFHLHAECINPYTVWLQDSVRQLVQETSVFTSAHL
jgi:hypothetical protein